MRETTQCSNELCNCDISAEMQTEEYCSTWCRDFTENGLESEACQCGHPQCDTPG